MLTTSASRAIEFIWRVSLIALVLSFTAFVAFGLIGLWLVATLWVWGAWGPDSVLYWMIGSSLVMLLVVVAAW